jgi:RNA polymerase sigma factor FliA
MDTSTTEHVTERKIQDIKTAWDDFLKNKKRDENKETLILNYLPLVKYVAGRLSVTLPSHVDRNDLVSSGTIGLMNAIENFDPQFKTKFETYAIIRIKGAMLDELRSLDWVPRSAREKFCLLQKAYAKLEQRYGRPATDIEVAKELGISTEELSQLLMEEKSVTVLSLNEILNYDDSENKSVAMINSVKDDNQASPYDNAELEEKKEMVAECIEQLPEQERIVITLYYYESLMLKEIGKVLNISESRVSQIHTKAIIRLTGKLRNIETFKKLAAHS